MMSETLADYLQIWGIEDGNVVFADGSMGFAFELTPVDVSCASDDTINDFSQRTMQFLNSLPSGLDLQFVQDIKGGNNVIIDNHGKLSLADKQSLAASMTEQRCKRLAQLDNDGSLPHHSLILVARRAWSGSRLRKPKIFAKQSTFNEMTEAAFQREISEVARLKEEMNSQLTALGLNPQSVAAEEMLNAIYLQWNPTRPIGLKGFDPETVRSSLLFSDVGISDRGFTIGGMHHRVISLKLLPDQSFSSMASVLRELPFDSRLFFTIHVPDQTKELESLQTQRRIAYSMAFGKKSGVSDIESTAKFTDLERLLEQMIAQGEKVFHAGMNVLLRSDDEEDLRTQVAQTLSVIREMGGAEGLEESLAAFDLFTQFSLPNSRVKDRTKRMKTSNLCDLVPLYGPWRGHREPRVLLRTRMGNLLSIDPFDPGLTNANQLVSGASGAGKSFLTNVLLLQMLKENPRVFFVDIGGSYKKLCENLSGQYVNLSLTEGIAINPFDLAPGETVPSSQKIKFLLGLIELMTKEDEQERLPRLERSEIEEAIQRLYDKSPSPRLSELRDALLAHPDASIVRYGRILNSWCGDTPYGRFVDRPTNVKLDSHVVAFDLKGLESYPDLQAICLFIITDRVWREVQRDRKTMKFLVFDECWKLLKSDAGLVFIEEVFRTFRKYYASAIAISQDIDDFAKSKIAGAILPNCAVKWVLLQPQGDKTRLKEVLALNDNEVALVSSLHQKKGVYSEAFLIAGANRTLAVIESAPLELWIATTDPRDLAAIDAYREKHPEKSHQEILKELSELYPRGVSAAG